MYVTKNVNDLMEQVVTRGQIWKLKNSECVLIISNDVLINKQKFFYYAIPIVVCYTTKEGDSEDPMSVNTIPWELKRVYHDELSEFITTIDPSILNYCVNEIMIYLSNGTIFENISTVDNTVIASRDITTYIEAKQEVYITKTAIAEDETNSEKENIVLDISTEDDVSTIGENTDPSYESKKYNEVDIISKASTILLSINDHRLSISESMKDALDDIVLFLDMEKVIRKQCLKLNKLFIELLNCNSNAKMNKVVKSTADLLHLNKNSYERAIATIALFASVSKETHLTGIVNTGGMINIYIKSSDQDPLKNSRWPNLTKEEKTNIAIAFNGLKNNSDRDVEEEMRLLLGFSSIQTMRKSLEIARGVNKSSAMQAANEKEKEDFKELEKLGIPRSYDTFKEMTKDLNERVKYSEILKSFTYKTLAKYLNTNRDAIAYYINYAKKKKNNNPSNESAASATQIEMDLNNLSDADLANKEVAATV